MLAASNAFISREVEGWVVAVVCAEGSLNCVPVLHAPVARALNVAWLCPSLEGKCPCKEGTTGLRDGVERLHR